MLSLIDEQSATSAIGKQDGDNVTVRLAHRQPYRGICVDFCPNHNLPLAI